ncbi:MAG: fused MFS/spermidine synthase [Mariprofundus sp.]|nr:fused MFS/spermidine synthase [Mariprofundus sp.]
MNQRRLTWALLALYGATGVTALAYEVLWTRMLSLMFGISIFGAVFTVTAFMAGLGVGSFVFTGRGVGKPARAALALLALLEGGIALYALALPLLMPWLDGFLLNLGSSLSVSGWQSLQGAAVLLMLFPAALAMGMAFPLALRAAASLHISLASMYGINAIGGATGAILPLLLLPILGWRESLWWVALTGLLLALCAWLLSRHLIDEAIHHQPEQVRRPPWSDLFAYAGIGAAALILEVVWTRLFGMILLRTEYILAVLLLVYLAGIGLGSLLARGLRTKEQTRLWLNVLPVLAALTAVAGLYVIDDISRWAAAEEFSSLAAAMLGEGAVVALSTLPVTLLLGAWLPLLARHFHKHETGSGGWWYGVNSIGAALGAMLAGFVLLPWLGSALSLCFAALLLFVCGMRWVTDKRIWLALPALLLLIFPVRALPPVSDLLPVLADVTDQSVFEDAVSLTHVVEHQQGLMRGQLVLLSDLQRMDASSDPTAVTVQRNQARLPLLLHPDPHSVLFLGLGTGITASGSLWVNDLQRTAVELSAGAIAAAGSAFAPVNGDISRHSRILRDDARRFLRSDQHHYDVIVGDLFHPDMVGRANLLSLQQFQRVRQRLNAGGIYAQWLALNQFDVASIQVVMATFRQVFPHASVFIDGYRMALVGMRGGSISMPQLLARFSPLSDGERRSATGGEGLWTWVGRYWGEIPLLQAPLQDEWLPVIEFSLPRVRYSGGGDVLNMWRWLLSWRVNDAKAMQFLQVPKQDTEAFRRARVGAGLDVRLWMAELSGDERRVVQMAKLANRANPKDRWPAFALADRMFDSLAHTAPGGLSRQQALQRILDLRPDHEGALRALMKLELQAGNLQAAGALKRHLQIISPLAKD